MSIYTHKIAMKMLTDLRKKIAYKSKIIDEKISSYFADRLGVTDVETINALGIDGNFTFNQKVNLFCELLPLTKIDKAKFKVFLQITNEFVLYNDDFELSHGELELNNYYLFLINTYSADMDAHSIKEKLTFAVHRLIDDVVMLIPYYIAKPKIYYNKNVGITLPE